LDHVGLFQQISLSHTLLIGANVQKHLECEVKLRNLTH